LLRLRSKYCRVGVWFSVLAFGVHRGRDLTPTRLAPIKSGLADLPLSAGQRVQVNSEAAAGFAADIAGPMRRAYGVS
jgi:hypothetical protein